MKILAKLNPKGFGHIEAVLAIAVIAMVGVVGVYISKHNNSHAAPLTSSTTASCPSVQYTCFGSSEIPGTNTWLVFYACLKTINLTKEGQGILYSVDGYALATAPVKSNDYAYMDDWTAASLGNVRWEVSSNKWLFGVVTSMSHSVLKSQINVIAFAAGTAGGAHATSITVNTAFGLKACPS